LPLSICILIIKIDIVVTKIGFSIRLAFILSFFGQKVFKVIFVFISNKITPAFHSLIWKAGAFLPTAT